MPNIYSSAEFENTYAYDGDDLGLTYSKQQSVFKVWAPTADKMMLNIYSSGTKGVQDLIESYPMTRGEKGYGNIYFQAIGMENIIPIP
jgi:pullulanase